MRARRDYSGYSLIDLIVALFLMSILTTVLVLFWKGIGRQHHAIGQRINIQEISESFLTQLERDLATTTPKGLHLAEGQPMTLGLQSFSALVSPGELHWSDEVVCYRHDPVTSTIKRWSASRSDKSSHFTVEDLDDIVSSDANPQVWGHIQECTIERPAGFPLLKVKLTLARDGGQSQHHLSRDLVVLSGFQP